VAKITCIVAYATVFAAIGLSWTAPAALLYSYAI